MLALTGQEHFYYVSGCTDMRYGYNKLTSIVRHKYLRDPANGDVYVFMNAARTTVRMFQFENNAYYLHEKHFVHGYKFMDIQTSDEGKTYYITWEDLCAVLETPVIKKLVLEKEAKGGKRKR